MTADPDADPPVIVHVYPDGEVTVHSQPDARFCDECLPKVGFWKKGAGC